jgi:hypothetical protein
LLGVARVLGSRTDGALEEEISWPSGTWTLLVWLARGAARFDTACALTCSLSCALSGCSAVAALAETHRAERTLLSTSGLRSTPATTYALTLSRAYLEKAREEASEAQYGAAVAYAKAATRAAQDAQRTQIQHRSWNGTGDSVDARGQRQDEGRQ